MRAMLDLVSHGSHEAPERAEPARDLARESTESRGGTGAGGLAVLTIDEAARLLRVNRKTLYDAVKADQVPGVVRLGRAIRIGRAALLSWVQGNGGPALGDDR